MSIKQLINLMQSKNEAPPIDAQSGSRIYQSRNAKIPNFSFFWRGGGEEVGSQILMLSPEILRSQIPLFFEGGVGSQLLMLNPDMLKSQIPISGGGGLVANF